MSFLKYSNYIDTGIKWIGSLPSHWELTRFKYVFKERDERSKDGSEVLLSVSAYTGVSPRSGIVDEGDHLSRAESLEGYKICYPNDLVINIMLAWNKGLGVSQYFGVVSPAYCVFEIINEHEPRFLNYLVRTERYTGYFKSFSSGVIDSRLRIYPDVFGALSVGLPPLKEQVEISDFLDQQTKKIDSLIAEQKTLIGLLKEKRQAVISRVVTKGLNPNVKLKDSGIEWLGKVPDHWQVGGLTRFIGPVVDYRGRTPTKVDEGVFLVTARNIRNGRIDYDASEEYVDAESADSLMNRGSPEIGDILFTMEAPLGQVALIDRLDIALAQRIVKFRGIKDLMAGEYLLYWLMCDVCQARLVTLATGSTALGIKSSKLVQIECLAPPIDEQKKIVAHIEKSNREIDKLIEEATSALNLLAERRTALVFNAVTGQIDVRRGYVN